MFNILVIRGMQIKIIHMPLEWLRNNKKRRKLTRLWTGEDVGQPELCKILWQFLIKENTHLTYDPSIYPIEMTTCM